MAAASPPSSGTASKPKGRRGRKQDDSLPPSRSRDMQRAFRARRAAHLATLEGRVERLERENNELRARLGMPPRPPSPELSPEGDSAQSPVDSPPAATTSASPSVLAQPRPMRRPSDAQPWPMSVAPAGSSAQTDRRCSTDSTLMQLTRSPAHQTLPPVVCIQPGDRTRPAPPGAFSSAPPPFSASTVSAAVSSADNHRVNHFVVPPSASMHGHANSLAPLQAPATVLTSSPFAGTSPLAPIQLAPASTPMLHRNILPPMMCRPTSSCCPAPAGSQGQVPNSASSSGSSNGATVTSTSSGLTPPTLNNISTVSLSPISSLASPHTPATHVPLFPGDYAPRRLPPRAPPPSPRTTVAFLEQYCDIPATSPVLRSPESAAYVNFLASLLAGLEVTNKGPLGRLSYTPEEELRLSTPPGEQCCGGLVDCEGPSFDEQEASGNTTNGEPEPGWLRVADAWDVVKDACYGAAGGDRSSMPAGVGKASNGDVGIGGAIDGGGPNMFGMPLDARLVLDDPMGLSASSLANMILDHGRQAHEPDNLVSRNVRCTARAGLVVRADAVVQIRSGWNDVKNICGAGLVPSGWDGPGVDGTGQRKCCAPSGLSQQSRVVKLEHSM